MKDVNKLIGENLKSLREERGFSLSALAELVEVSKSMLSQIEKGETNPSVGIIWKIANGLRVSFTSLLNDEPTAFQVVRKNEIQRITQEDQKYAIWSYFPYDPNRRFEMYTFELEAESGHYSEAHVKGVEEYFIVTSGKMTVAIGSKEVILNEGDAITFKADREHSYVNKNKDSASGTIVLYYQN